MYGMMYAEEVVYRRPIDTIKNWQGEALIKFLGKIRTLHCKW